MTDTVHPADAAGLAGGAADNTAPSDLPPHLMAKLPEGYYLPVAGKPDHYETTRATSSPWDQGTQHGGPPTALLAHAVESLLPDPDMPIARITLDILGPIPRGEVRTRAQIERQGKKIEMATAQLLGGDSVVACATVWRKRLSPGTTAAQETHVPVPQLPRPQQQAPYFKGVPEDWGYGNSIEWRHNTRATFDASGYADVWMRTRIPLIAGAPTSAVARMAIMADSANGVSPALPFEHWLFVPSTVTLTVSRPPRTDWINLTARTFVSDSGSGMTTAEMYDLHGPVASVNQPLLVAARR